MSFHIIGDRDTILGFAFAGIPGSAVDGAEEAQGAFAAARSQRDLKILIVTEAVSEMLAESLLEHRASAQSPFVVEVSDIWGTPVKRLTLEEMIQEAIGIKITRE